jgi:predicted RNA-binding Zn ribbon-like protein
MTMQSEMRVVEEFLNTVDERSFTRHGEAHSGGEHLVSPAVLSDWLIGHRLVAPGTRVRPADLTVALALRAALRTVLIDGTDVSKALEGFPLRLVSDPNGGLRIAAVSGRPGLDRIMETVAVSTATGEWGRLKLCAAPDCRWAFYDTSRSGGGRWCSMSACGNRTKTRAYRLRHQQTA